MVDKKRPKNKRKGDFLPFGRENNLKPSKTFDKGYLGCIKGFTQKNQSGVWVWREGTSNRRFRKVLFCEVGIRHNQFSLLRIHSLVRFLSSIRKK